MANKRVLIVDDEQAIREVLSDLFNGLGYHVGLARDGNEGLDAALSSDIDLAVLDVSLPGMNGLDLLRVLKESKPDLPVIMVTGYASMSAALKALKLGAYDYIKKPFNLDDVQSVAQRAVERQRLIDENRYLKNELRMRYGFDNVIGLDAETQKAYIMAARVADSRASVLILGETGTGKEYLARSIHYQSPRAEGPFVKVSCAALPESLLESELFGHEKGSFTGAIARRTGRFELADGGTLFLDEIGDTTATTQIKLLRALQEKKFERLGGSETLSVDVRIIAATNRDLRKAIADKLFREDLYYRLNVVPITLPPLRERRQDIPEFVEHLVRKYNEETGKHIQGVTQEGISMLQSYLWPGNIRELENCIERAVILCQGSVILPQHLLLNDSPPQPAAPRPQVEHKTLRDIEKEHIELILLSAGGNQTRAASVLAIDRKTLRNKIRDYGLDTNMST
ncbi:MAG: sigma-54 dependent transcriptional regulator [Armatimonadota bacterium]|nr:sigma-54 dependent transcriptional regulator [Armatimonadota bacterium]